MLSRRGDSGGVSGIYLWWRRLLKRSFSAAEILPVSVETATLGADREAALAGRITGRRSPGWVKASASLRVLAALGILVALRGMLFGHVFLHRFLGW
jgi:hypothetical protein